MDKYYKKIRKLYDKKLEMIKADNLSMTGNSIDYFITYLKYLRDSYFILAPEDIQLDTKNPAIAVSTTIMEYDKIESCFSNHFRPAGGQTFVPVNKDKTMEEAQKDFTEEQELHKKNFWELVYKYNDSFSILEKSLLNLIRG